MALQPARHNLSAWPGATFRKRFTLHAGDEDDPVENLTGFTAVLEIHRGPDVIKTLTVGNGGIVMGGAAGTIDLYMSAAETEAFPQRTSDFTLKLTWPGPGDTEVLVAGKFVMNDWYG